MRLRALLAKHGKGMAFERFIKHALFSGPEQEDTVISVKQLHLQLSRFMTATVPRTSVSHENNEKDIANLTRALDAAKWTPEELWEAVSTVEASGQPGKSTVPEGSDVATSDRMNELLSKVGAALAVRGRKPQIFLEAFDPNGVGYVTMSAIEPALRLLLCAPEKEYDAKHYEVLESALGQGKGDLGVDGLNAALGDILQTKKQRNHEPPRYMVINQSSGREIVEQEPKDDFALGTRTYHRHSHMHVGVFTWCVLCAHTQLHSHSRTQTHVTPACTRTF